MNWLAPFTRLLKPKEDQYETKSIFKHHLPDYQLFGWKEMSTHCSEPGRIWIRRKK